MPKKKKHTYMSQTITEYMCMCVHNILQCTHTHTSIKKYHTLLKWILFIAVNTMRKIP
jgi:hypothetical protein